MANPQKENGKTEIANEILDYLCRFRMPGEVRQIVDTVIRKTYGWHKTWDKISNSQFIEMTGLSKGNVSRSLSKAITNKLVIKNDNNQLCFNKDYDQWISFKKVIKTATKVIKSDNKKLSKVRDTKETTKETNKRNITNVIVAEPQDLRKKELQEIIDYADGLCFVTQGTQKMNRFNAYNLLKKFGVENSKKAIRMAVECRGKPYAPTINDFIQLYRKIGDLLTYYKKETDGKRGYRI